MSERKLKLYNGRWYPQSHAYIAAYSVSDAMRVCAERGFKIPRSEITQYWNHGTWGNSMAGIEPKRGLWVQKERFDKPEFVESES